MITELTPERVRALLGPAKRPLSEREKESLSHAKWSAAKRAKRKEKP